MNPSIYPDSYYAATANPFPLCPPLDDTLDCDVCIVGGGYSGLSAALHLAERGYDVILLEAQRIGWGASGRNGGQLAGGQRQDQDELEQRFGLLHARQLWDLGEAAKALVKQLIDRHAIDCDLKPGILYADHKPTLPEQSHRYVDKLRRTYGYEAAEAVDQTQIRQMLGSKAYYGGWLDHDAAHLHPLNFALGLAQVAQQAGARLFENSRVVRYTSQQAHLLVHTDQGEIRAKQLILACNGYLDTLEPRLADYIMPLNNFILATEPLGEQAAEIIRDDVAVADSRFVINYFRLSADGRLLFGGGENYTRRFPSDIKQFVRRYMLKIYPQLSTTRIDYAWGGTLAITVKRLPHFGCLGDNIWFAHGYSGQGLGLATLAGQLLAEALSGTQERFDVMASLPATKFPGGRWLRWPGQVLGMLYFSLRDRL